MTQDTDEWLTGEAPEGGAANTEALSKVTQGVNAIVDFFNGNEDKIGVIPNLMNHAMDLYGQIPEEYRYTFESADQFAELLPTLGEGPVDEMDSIDGYTMAGDLPKAAAADGYNAELDAAVKEMRRKEADGPNPTYYAKDDQDFLEYGGTEETTEGTPNLATTKEVTPVIEPVVEAKGIMAPVTSRPNTHPPGSIDVRLTGWDNLAGLESDTLHVDHTGVITMGWGVVPDGGVTLDGKDINVKKDHGLTSTSTLSGVDTSKAYKKVNGVTYKREDYTTDLAFSQAVYTGFYESAKANVDNFDDLTDEHKEVIIDLGYNAGETAFTKWNDTDTLAKELVKDVGDRTITNLTQFTDNFAAGKKFGGGVLRRRALSANKVLGADDQIAYIEQGKAINGIVKFSLKRSDGTTVRAWDRAKAKVNDYPKGKPILTIDGERKATY